MSTSEHRKKKGFCGAIRLFQLSVQEMGTTDKHPNTHNLQNKSRSSPENSPDQKDVPHNSHNKNSLSPEISLDQKEVLSVCQKEDNGEQKSSLCLHRKEVSLCPQNEVSSPRTTPEKGSHITASDDGISPDVYPLTPKKNVQTAITEREDVTCNPQKTAVSHKKQTTPQKRNQLDFNPYSNFPKEKTPPRFWKYKFREEEDKCDKDSLAYDSTLSSRQKLSECDIDKNNNVLSESDDGNKFQKHESDFQLQRKQASYSSYRHHNTHWHGSTNNDSFYRSRGGYHHYSRGGYNRYLNSFRLPPQQDGNTLRMADHSTPESHTGNHYDTGSMVVRNHCMKGNTQCEDWSTELLNISDWYKDDLSEKQMDKLSVCDSTHGNPPLTLDLKSQQSAEEESVWSEVDVVHVERKLSENQASVEITRETLDANGNKMAEESLFNNNLTNKGSTTLNVDHTETEQWIIEDHVQGEDTPIDEVVYIEEETNLNLHHSDSHNVQSACIENIITQENKYCKDDKQSDFTRIEKSSEAFVDGFEETELPACIYFTSNMVNKEISNIRSSSPVQNKHNMIESEFVIDPLENENDMIMECEAHHFKSVADEMKEIVLRERKDHFFITNTEFYENRSKHRSFEQKHNKIEGHQVGIDLKPNENKAEHFEYAGENFETEIMKNKEYTYQKKPNHLLENENNKTELIKHNNDIGKTERESEQLEMYGDEYRLIGSDHEQSGTYQEFIDKYELVCTDHENDLHGRDEILDREQVTSEQEHDVNADKNVMNNGNKIQHQNVQLESEGMCEHGMEKEYNAEQWRIDCQVESDAYQIEEKSVEIESTPEFINRFESFDINETTDKLLNNGVNRLGSKIPTDDIATHFDETVHQKSSTDFESDVSAHFDDYDNLIKAKIKDMRYEIKAKIEKQKHEKEDEIVPDSYEFLYPEFEKSRRSRSLPGSPYMQVVELMQQFRHRHTQRKFLLERQKQQQSSLESAKVKPVMGRGRGTVSISQDSLTSESSAPQGDEDWELDLIPLDDFLISDQNLPDGETNEDNLDLNHDCPQDLKESAKTPASNSYMTVENTEVKQMPSPYYNKQYRYVPKGRGCLSPAFKKKFNEFLLNVDQKRRLVVPERKGFDIHNHNKERRSNVPFYQSQNRQMVNTPEENWENSLIDIDYNEGNVIVKNAEKDGCNITEKVTDMEKLDLIHTGNGCHGDAEFKDNEEYFKTPAIKNQNFVNEYLENIVLECDSSSMSSLPHCELLSPKSQSTLSGVPTMSDYENSEIGQLDTTKNDIQDEVLDDIFSDMKTNFSDSLRSNNKLAQNSQCTGEFVVKNESENNNELSLPDQNKPTTAEYKQNNKEDEASHYYLSYYYPDLPQCQCPPSVQQYWVWHTCMCQVPRLCEIRTCQDYWLQYPFQDMDGIYYTTPVPDINSNRKFRAADKNGRESKDSPDESNGRGHNKTVVPPGFTKESRSVLPPPMPWMTCNIPMPPSRQIWEKMHGGPSLTRYRMSYRGPQPNAKDIPVHLIKQDSRSSRTVISPFVCAQGYYQNYSNSVDSNNNRHKSDNENGGQNDSGVVLEGSPEFIGPVLPPNVKLHTSSDSVSPVSAVRQLLGEGKATPRKRLVDYSYSETDESEDDGSGSSQVEKRLKDSSGEVVVVTDSNSEDDNSHRDSSKGRKVIESKRSSGSESKHPKDSNFPKEDGEITDESDGESSKFEECSSSFSNYQILQSVLNKKFPRNQRHRGSSKEDGDSDHVDLTDDGSEIFSVASQESNELEIKQKSVYAPFWASPGIRHDSPICGYSGVYAPYTYPGWVSPEMITAGYGTSSPEIVQQDTSPADNSSRTLTTSPGDSVTCQDENKSPEPEQKDDDAYVRRGNVSIRGMAARLRFLNNSKLVEGDTTFHSRLSQLQKGKHQDTDSESHSTSSSWKVKFLSKCERYNGRYIDSHCHLDFLFTRSEYGGTWTKFKQDNMDTMPYNFEGCVAVFCHPSSFRADGMWNKFTEEGDVWMTFGCHPKNATEYTEKTEMNLKLCLMNRRVVALGEIGLDYSGIFIKHKEVQQIAFRKQIQIALEMNKPLVIHCREAEEDALAILDEMVPKNYKIHCHCFTGNYESAKKWMDMFPNLFIGLTPLVTYRTATSTHEVARFIPLERLLLETDAPYFVPRKCPRSEMQHSHPGMAITVAEEVAWLKKCPVSEVIQSCRQNTRLMYGI